MDNSVHLVEKKVGGISQVTWKEVCDHIEKVEEAYFESDCILDEISEQFVVSINESESDTNIHESDDVGCSVLTENIDFNDKNIFMSHYYYY